MNPKFKAELDPQFQPMSVVYRDFVNEAEQNGGQKLVIGIERNKGYMSTFTTTVFPDGVKDDENIRMVERIVKSLLWFRGGYKIIIAGSKVVFEGIKKAYAKSGARAFDNDFMAGVYEREFQVEWRPIEDAPTDNEGAAPVGRHLDGCRIGLTQAALTVRLVP